MPAAAQKPIQGPKCGFSLVDAGNGKRVYLETISSRRGISCADAKSVYRGALRRLGSNRVLCGRGTYSGWTIRHRGHPQALSARFTKGSRSFNYASQGSC